MKFNVAPSPNPCRFTKNTLTFRGLPVDAQDVKIYIYNSVGELVRELDSGVVVWDGKNKQGARVASGIYIYLVKTSNRGKARGKLYAVW